MEALFLALATQGKEEHRMASNEVLPTHNPAPVSHGHKTQRCVDCPPRRVRGSSDEDWDSWIGELRRVYRRGVGEGGCGGLRGQSSGLISG